jgi:hypothetical protein
MLRPLGAAAVPPLDIGRNGEARERRLGLEESDERGGGGGGISEGSRRMMGGGGGAREDERGREDREMPGGRGTVVEDGSSAVGETSYADTGLLVGLVGEKMSTTAGASPLLGEYSSGPRQSGECGRRD